jgi:hypothetical protein
VECGKQDRLDISGVALDRRDRVDHFEDLLEREVPADFARALRGRKDRLAGNEDPLAALAEERVAAI